MKRLAIFASGTGSNFEAVADAAENGSLQAEIAVLVCDRPGAAVIGKAESRGIPAVVFSPNAFARKAEFEEMLIAELKCRDVEWIVLAGYMRLIGPALLAAYENRIVNIHPSLLPDFPGKDAVGQAIRARAERTGVTVHFVDAGMDTGPIIAQDGFAISPEDSPEEIFRRIHEIEHKLYPAVLAKMLAGEENRRGKDEKSTDQCIR